MNYYHRNHTVWFVSQLFRNKDDPILYNHKNDKGKDVFFNYSITILNKAIKERAKGAIVLVDFSESSEAKKFQFPIASIVLDEEKGGLLRDYFAKDGR